MTLARILALKGSDVVTASPRRTMGDIVKLLAEKRVGAVIIADADGYIAGIISERDVVRTLAQRGADVLADAVSEHMTRAVVTASADETVDEIMDRMTEGKFRHVPIVDGRRLVGMISIGDLVKHRMAMAEAEASAMRDYIATA
ncbi:CBS domain-containing protein [Methylopila turkensis]|uniref:Inosine-5-monophosphate dehydrogenase n=1 Tax=Methylopila turkensis TaxID=1437816 RepID=A0A9W6JPF7_9HYPH|nr:CBS domain-containing protein [Methylopila turkensis]GLK81345.1 inosine-5-monophosphate dehydrogenase [Methylopila turkensis]